MKAVVEQSFLKKAIAVALLGAVLNASTFRIGPPRSQYFVLTRNTRVWVMLKKGHGQGPHSMTNGIPRESPCVGRRISR